MSVNIRMMSGDMFTVSLRLNQSSIIENLSEDIFTYLNNYDPENIQYMKIKEGTYKLQNAYSYRIIYLDENGEILKYLNPTNGLTYNILIKNLPVFCINQDTSTVYLESGELSIYGDTYILVNSSGLDFISSEKEKLAILCSYMDKYFSRRFGNYSIFSFS